ncbi:adenylyl-sulfate kinase [Azospirillum largimobile]
MMPSVAGPAPVLWITGLSGAGKTTVACLLVERLRLRGGSWVMLDGDRMRAMLPWPGGYEREEREKIAFYYGRLCAEISGQGIGVVCATVSMFHSVRRWNRDAMPGYREIYLRVPIGELRRRDSKGLYAASAASGLVGVDIVAEMPETPDLVIENHGGRSPGDAVSAILAAMERDFADTVPLDENDRNPEQTRTE